METCYMEDNYTERRKWAIAISLDLRKSLVKTGSVAEVITGAEEFYNFITPDEGVVAPTTEEE